MSKDFHSFVVTWLIFQCLGQTGACINVCSDIFTIRSLLELTVVGSPRGPRLATADDSPREVGVRPQEGAEGARRGRQGARPPDEAREDPAGAERSQGGSRRVFSRLCVTKCILFTADAP